MIKGRKKRLCPFVVKISWSHHNHFVSLHVKEVGFSGTFTEPRAARDEVGGIRNVDD